jgi:hypothetical protein
LTAWPQNSAWPTARHGSGDEIAAALAAWSACLLPR